MSFGSPALNATPGLSTPAVPPRAVDEAVVGQKTKRCRRVYSSLETTTADRIPLISDRDQGLVEIRKAETINQATGGAVAHAWFVPAITAALRPVNNRLDRLSDRMDVFSAHVANFTITRQNTVISCMFDVVTVKLLTSLLPVVSGGYGFAADHAVEDSGRIYGSAAHSFDKSAGTYTRHHCGRV